MDGKLWILCGIAALGCGLDAGRPDNEDARHEIFLPYIAGGGEDDSEPVCETYSVETSAACPLYNEVHAEVEYCDGSPTTVTVTTPPGLPQIDLDEVMLKGRTVDGLPHAELATRVTSLGRSDRHVFAFDDAPQMDGAIVDGQLYFPVLYDAGHDCYDTFSIEYGEPEARAAAATGWDFKCDFSRMNCLEVYQSFFGWEHPDTGDTYPVSIVGCVHWDNTEIMGNHPGPTPCASQLIAQGVNDVPKVGTVGHLNAEFAVCSYQPNGNLKYRGSLADLHSTGWVDTATNKGCSASYNVNLTADSGAWGVGLPETCYQATCVGGRDLTDSLQEAWDNSLDWFAQREQDIEDWMITWGVPVVVASATAYVIIVVMEAVLAGAFVTATVVPGVPPPP